VDETTKKARLKRIFTREFPPLKALILLISSLFLRIFILQFHTAAYQDRSDSPSAKTPLNFKEVFNPLVRLLNQVLGFSEGPFGLLTVPPV
jgi:hypothetical protein